MKYIKTYEGLFDFFRKKQSEDDKIALEFIKRLKRVKGISPYSLSYNPEGSDEGSEYMRYRVIFDDTPIRIGRYSVTDPRSRGWDEETQSRWIKEDGAVKKNNKVFYRLYLETPDESVLASWDILEELFDLTEKVFKENKTAKRIKKIRDETNPAADILDDNLDNEDN